MRKQTVLWTALPNGVVGSGGGARLKLSALLTPRLWTDEGLPKPTLSQFGDFVDWPATAIQFEVQFGAGAPVAATRVGPPPDSALWAALFGPSTFVRPYDFPPLQNRPIRSYPVGNVQAFLKQQYVKVADASGDEFPTAETLLADDAFGPIAFGAPARSLTQRREGADEDALAAEIERLLAAFKAVPPAAPDAAFDFLQLRQFHRAPTPKRVAKLALPEFDFHQALSALSAYPVLLRRLGLVHDLELALPATLGATTVQVIARWTPSEPNTEAVPDPDANPPRRQLTRCIIATNRFEAAPRANDPDLADGLLRLDDASAYDVVQIDTDGAAITAMDFAANIARATSVRKTDDTPEAYSLPSLRSAGIAVARVGRALQTHERFARASSHDAALTAKGDVVLDAEDITRGYAIDVWDSDFKRWHSLCERQGVYDFLNAAVTVEAADEGWVSGAVTAAADDSSLDLRQSEFLFRWRGWSLAAPQPGKVMDAAGAPSSPVNTALTEFQLETNFRATPGSLPRLRYGVSYRLRARAVDLAGNRRSMADPALSGFLHATPALSYGRFEPVATPVVVLRQPRTEGEAADRLVLRSNFDEDPSPATVERHVVPPKTSGDVAETHGLFDDAASGVVATSAYAEYLNPPTGGVIRPWEGGSIGDVGTLDASDYGLSFVDAAKLPLPYLPDLFARGAVLRGLPGAGGAEVVDLGPAAGQSWPDGRPFRLVVDGGTGPPELGNGVLRVHLPKAEVVQVRLSAHLNAADVDQMGLLQWMAEAGLPTAALRAQTIAGRHWMLTPYRTLTLVHAVRQPLLTPEFLKFAPHKELGSSVATFSGTLQVHRKSTVKVDLLAEWAEPIDALDQPIWQLVQGKARPFDLPVPSAQEPGEEEQLTVRQDRARHEFGDTKHRRVRYSAIATSRFGEYFLERKKGVLLSTSVPFTLDAKGVVAGTDAVRRTDGGAAFVRGEDYTINYADGTITALGNSIVGQSVNIAYQVPPITRVTETPVTIDIPSSARPAAPKVLYAIPTFGWTTSAEGPDAFLSERKGNGLRVYLDRPWWSSGEGELLGVVLHRPAPFNLQPPERLKPYVTQWGLDPLFESGSTVTTPALSSFPLSAPGQQGTALSLDEVADAVDVAGHVPGYDQERGLWYVDIEIDAGDTYFPFVRLALVRFQPKSVAGAHLSRVVLSDFVQLTPDRTASISRDPANAKLLHVGVSGRSYGVLKGAAGPSQIEVSVEQRRPGIDPEAAGELAWGDAIGPPVVLQDQRRRSGGTTSWLGDVTLPAGAGPFRVVIKEFELYPVAAIVPLTQRRLVYADAIEV